jgi:DNA-binding CsgD family transcriptional regulator
MNKDIRRPELSVLDQRGTTPRTVLTSLNGNGLDLELLGEPAAAIDRDGYVIRVNIQMESLLENGVLIHNNRLRLSDAEARVRLRCLMEAIKSQSILSECDPIVVKHDDMPPVVLRAIMIPPAAQAFFFGAAAILIFLPMGFRSRPLPSLLSQIFGLTPAEARLASELAAGNTLTKSAEALHISWETARTQLKAVFAKTKTHRQGELVALLARV